jgi:hypothetical protein
VKPRGHWKNKENQKKFFDQLAIKWHIHKKEDWNKVTKEMVLNEGGYFVVKYYNGSAQQGTTCDRIISYILKALQAIYPDYVPEAKPHGYWKDKSNQKNFFDELAIKWNIQKTDDWKSVTKEMVRKEGGSFIRRYYNGSLQQGIISRKS